MPGKPRALKGDTPYRFRAADHLGGATVTLRPGEAISYELWQQVPQADRKRFDTTDDTQAGADAQAASD
jgi:hypothetical protein